MATPIISAEQLKSVLPEDTNIAENTTYVSVNVVSKFEKVSFEEFKKSYTPIFIAGQKLIQGLDLGDPNIMPEYTEEQLDEEARTVLESIRLPERATVGSAGHDFFFPYGATELPPSGSIIIPTGIKAKMIPGWSLLIYPRSSLGLYYNIQLDDTISVIDQDYYNNPKNEGHIYIKITNHSKDKSLILEPGKAFCQGIFIPFGVTIDDKVTATRTGGSGSTDTSNQ